MSLIHFVGLCGYEIIYFNMTIIDSECLDLKKSRLLFSTKFPQLWRIGQNVFSMVCKGNGYVWKRRISVVYVILNLYEISRTLGWKNCNIWDIFLPHINWYYVCLRYLSLTEGDLKKESSNRLTLSSLFVVLTAQSSVKPNRCAGSTNLLASESLERLILPWLDLW